MLNRFIFCFIDMFCRRHFDKAGSAQTARSNKTQQQQEEDPGVFCAACQTLLSQRQQAMEFAGGHRHCFVNPLGIEFEIALYRRVRCKPYGPATLEHTWFAGHAWQNVLCTSCDQHLGWCYHRPDSPDFYGLITDRFIEK